MARRQVKVQREVPRENPARESMVQIKNLQEKSFLLPVLQDDGTTKNLSVRVQGRGGQKPPVIKKKFVSERMRDLARRKLIKIIDV